ncbi:hypothetical protein [Planobispora takensis]|uniref:SWIM-type domain-containing protein n=1 Tax=Planobispora takensis TaxID=1367882 RepID=A0A8J3T8D2_9ACTN|nr:hypothetical protein [Planobispora takensis]GII02794.1 hypothetical protein Pta02_48020 [Planobispora takensis]
MRTDLLALTPDSLAALTNRGLVKRAAKELDNAAPRLRTDADGTVHGEFPDGPTAGLPPGGLDAGRCTCGATGVCRHLIGVIMAYQRAERPDEEVPVEQRADRPSEGSPAEQRAGEPGVELPAGRRVEGPGTGRPPARPSVSWSPGQVTDDELTARIGTRMMAAARRTEQAGYTARVRRATAADPVPQVELATATVRFLVPGDLGFVHTDTVAGSRDEIIALAVWAFRAADDGHPGVPDVRVDVGGVEAGTGSGLERALALAATVLHDGATHLGPSLQTTVADVRRHLDDAGLRWPLLAVDDLAEQLTAYHGRGAHYRPELLAGHIAELHARHRTVTRPDATLRSSVLGTAEAAETPLRRARLDSLGCRVRALGDQRIAEVYLAHGAGAMVLVLRRHWDGDADGAELSRRRIATTTLSALAAGNLVTESAVRSASRTVRLATGRISKTTVSPSRGAWDELPPSLVATDFAALARELDTLAPRPIRPRVEAELVRVVAVAGVESVTYAPGDQRLDAVILDRAGHAATVSATHTGAAPGRLDTLAAVLAGAEGELRFISGIVRRTAGNIVIEPVGLATGDRVVVPDLRPAGNSGRLTTTDAPPREPLAAALTDTRDLLAEAPHRGLNHLPPTYGGRLADAAHRLTALGLHRVAQAVTAFAATLTGDRDQRTEHAWVDAYLRLEIALDLC